MNYYTNKLGEESLIGKVDCNDATLAKLNFYAELYERTNGNDDYHTIDFHLLSDGIFSSGAVVDKNRLDNLFEDFFNWVAKDGSHVVPFFDENEHGYSAGVVAVNDGSFTRLTLLSSSNSVPHHNIYTDPDPDNNDLPKTKIAELAEGEALKQFAESFLLSEEEKEWCKQTLEIADHLIHGMELTGFREPVSVNTEVAPGKYIEVSLDPFPYQGIEEPKSISDIDGYMTDSDVISGGGYSIYQYAANIANYAALEKESERFAESVYDFYVEKVMPYEGTPYSELPENVKDDMGLFSDMHKDVYGFRPHSDETNMCKQIYLEQKKLHMDNRRDSVERD